jgi:hypothetical protein
MIMINCQLMKNIIYPDNNVLSDSSTINENYNLPVNNKDNENYTQSNNSFNLPFFDNYTIETSTQSFTTNNLPIDNNLLYQRQEDDILPYIWENAKYRVNTLDDIPIENRIIYKGKVYYKVNDKQYFPVVKNF